MDLGRRLLALNKAQKKDEILKLLRSSTNEQISEALHLQLTRSEDGSVADLVQIIFQNSMNSSDASRRLDVYKVAIKLLQNQNITNRAATEIVGFLLMETDNLPASHLAELADVFTDAVKRSEPANGKAFELLQKIILSLAAKETVSYGNITLSGAEYKDHVLNSLSAGRWDPHCVIHLAAMFKEVPLTSDQLKFIMTKIIKLCKDVDFQELPPLVYQLLLLTTKGHKRLVLSGLTSFLTKQDKLCKAQHQEQNQNTLSIISQDVLRHMEGTVILHIAFAIKQDQDLGKEFVKFLEASKVSSTAAVLSPFNVALALSVAQIHRFEEPIFNFLKSAILRSFTDAERQSASHWISVTTPGSEDVTESVLDTVQNSSGWDHVTQGLVQLGFTLMDAYGPKSKEHQPCTNTPSQRACSLGSQILISTFKAHEMVRGEILQQLLNRIVTKESASVSHYIGLLTNTVTSAPQILLDSLPKMQGAFDYLAFLAPSSADGLLKAVQPLMKLNVSLKDSLLLVLRKAMFARQGDARKIAVSGYLQILKNFQVYKSLPASQIASQSSMSSFRQTTVDIHVEGSQQTNYEAIVCLEILGSLRRCFTQQADVKLILYEGLYEVLNNNSKLKDTIVDMLSKQWIGYYEADEDVNPPIKLQRCIMAQGDKVYTSEPLSHLLQCICHCVVRCKKLIEQSNYDDDWEEEEDEAEIHMKKLLQHLESVLSSLTRRMIKSDLEDFELDKSADFSETSSVGVKNNIFGSLVLGMYEVLMEYNFTDTDFSATSAGQLLQLFSNYHKLSEILHDKSSQRSKSGHKAARSLLSIKFVSRTLKLLFSDDSPDRQDCLIMLREESDFFRYIVSIALQKIQQLNEKGQCDGPAGNRMEELYQFCHSVSRDFLHKFTADTFTPPEGGRSERKKAVSSMCLEGLSTSINVICSRFPERIAGYLKLIDPDIELEDDHTDTQEEERVHLHIKKFQRLVMNMITSDDGSSTKNAVLLCGIITLLAKQLKPQGAQFVQLQAWLSRVCAEQVIEDTGLAKALLSLLFTLTQQFQSTASLIREVAQDLHSQIGDIDETVDVVPSKNFAIVNAETAAPTVLLLLMSQIDKFLDETEWVVTRMEAGIGNESDEEVGGLTQQEDCEKVICNRLGMLVNAFYELVQSAIPVGPCVDATLKSITRLFTTVTLLCKYYMSLYRQRAGHLSSRFEKLIKLLATRLTQNVYSMITYIQTSQSERLNQAAARTGKAKEKKRGEGEGRGMSGKAKSVMKETRAIPSLVYAIEKCEQLLIKLSKMSKVDLMEHIKLSTSRDFRINTRVVQEVTEQASSDEESSSDDESPPPSKRSKTDYSPHKLASKK